MDGFNDEIESTFFEFPDDFSFDLDLLLPDPPAVEDWNSDSMNSPTGSDAPAAISSIEKFLMDDGEEEARVEGGDISLEDFWSDVFADGFGSGSGSDGGRCEVASPESGGSTERSEVAAEEAKDGEEEEEEEGDEETRKKRRRQMRNRESAMQSRERKKIYVKDLEIKSKFLESEVRRLDYALRCCMAENLSLHQRLHKDSALAAKQESAVLFVESLLLGSLFWLVSFLCLFLVPSLQSLNSHYASRLGRGLVLEVPKVVINEKSQPVFGNDALVIMRRRCRGSRARMKSIMFPLHVVSA